MSYPPQGYPQPGQPQYPPPQQPQGYPPQQGYYPPPAQQYGPPQPPAQPLARGTIDDFYNQPSASGKSISFDRKPVGTTYSGIVARTITHADIQQQTDIHRMPLFHPDRRPKYVMVIPLIMQPTQEFPDGRAAWYCKGNDKTELERAMEEAGLPPGTAPEMGAAISITYTGDRPIPGLNAQKMKTITYRRPANVQGNGTVTQQPAAQAQQPASPPVQQPPFQAPYQQPALQYNQGPGYASTEYTPPQPGPASPPAAPAPQPAEMQVPAGLTPEQQELLRQLTSGER